MAKCLIPGCPNPQQDSSPHCSIHQPFLPGVASLQEQIADGIKQAKEENSIVKRWKEVEASMFPPEATVAQRTVCKQFFLVGIQTGLVLAGLDTANAISKTIAALDFDVRTEIQKDQLCFDKNEKGGNA